MGTGALVLHLVVGVGAVLGITRCLRDLTLRPYGLFLAGLVAYFCIVAGPQGNYRFRLPAMPALCALAGLGFAGVRCQLTSAVARSAEGYDGRG